MGPAWPPGRPGSQPLRAKALWPGRGPCLKSSSTAWGKVWKLLFRLMGVPSTRAIFPNICGPHGLPGDPGGVRTPPSPRPHARLPRAPLSPLPFWTRVLFGRLREALPTEPWRSRGWASLLSSEPTWGSEKGRGLSGEGARTPWASHRPQRRSRAPGMADGFPGPPLQPLRFSGLPGAPGRRRGSARPPPRPPPPPRRTAARSPACR